MIAIEYEQAQSTDRPAAGKELLTASAVREARKSTTVNFLSKIPQTRCIRVTVPLGQITSSGLRSCQAANSVKNKGLNTITGFPLFCTAPSHRWKLTSSLPLLWLQELILSSCFSNMHWNVTLKTAQESPDPVAHLSCENSGCLVKPGFSIPNLTSVTSKVAQSLPKSAHPAAFLLH